MVFPFIDCKTGVFLRWSIKRMRAVFERKVWSECENGEWDWGEQALRACEARALRTRGSTLSALRALRPAI